jgi:hypothetical protein
VPAKGNRQKTEPRHIRLYHSMLATPAWRGLSGNAVKVLIAICQLNNGANNGGIFLSARDAASRTGLSVNTASKCLQELAETGFLEIVEKGAFSRKTKTATTYRVTWLAVGSDIPATSGLQRAPTHAYKNSRSQ